jgi:methylenetetrahydrofolate--tRNA-(uracil-5-)-methyltransferase
MFGALCEYIVHSSPADFQPMKANFGIMPPLMGMERSGRRQRAQAYADRALRDFEEHLKSIDQVAYAV